MKKFITFIPKEVKVISEMFYKRGFELYLVGGCVRDLLMYDTPHDWDMCTNATPEQMKQICKEESLFYNTIGEKHGTIVFFLNGGKYEITTYRVDGNYSDGRHPDEVIFTSSLEEDLSRRDFTMNAIAMSPETAELIDPFGGLDDIQNTRLVAVGNADERIKEDSLRMLRAIRFVIKYNMSMDEELSNSIHANIDLINNVSKERITEEFRKIFAAGRPITPNFLWFSDLITAIIPELKPCVGFKQNNKYHKHDVYEHMLSVVDLCKSNKFEIKMAALLHDIGKPDSYVEDDEGYGHFYGHPEVSANIVVGLLDTRFRLTKEETKRILELVEFHDKDIAKTVKSVRKALNQHGEDYMRDWFILKQADMDDHVYPDDKHINNVAPLVSIMDYILKENMAFSLKDLHITGNIIMQALRLKPGKMVGIILNKLLEEVVDGQLENTGEVLVARAKEIFKEQEEMK